MKKVLPFVLILCMPTVVFAQKTKEDYDAMKADADAAIIDASSCFVDATTAYGKLFSVYPKQVRVDIAKVYDDLSPADQATVDSYFKTLGEWADQLSWDFYNATNRLDDAETFSYAGEKYASTEDWDSAYDNAKLAYDNAYSCMTWSKSCYITDGPGAAAVLVLIYDLIGD